MIDETYAAVPHVPCKGLCQRACGPIGFSAAESEAMSANGINPPGVREHPTNGPLSCSHLTDAGRCAIYDHRPLVCRLFGAVRLMKCPHGCKPVGGFLPDEVAGAMIRKLNNGREPCFSLPLHSDRSIT